MSIETTHKQYDKYSKQWERTRDVLGGDDDVKAKTEAYVPKLSSQDKGSAEYLAYLNRAVFSEIAAKILTNATGLIFAKQPHIVVPTALETLLEDVTLTGQSFYDLTKEGVYETLAMGRMCYLIDVAQNKEEDKAFSERPFMQSYKTETVINWKYVKENNVQKLSLVVLEESEDVWVDEFTNEPQTIYRVLRLENNIYTQQVYKKDSTDDKAIFKGEAVITPQLNGKPLNEIPFYGITPNMGTVDVSKSPLIGIVDLNLSHFVINVDLRHQLHEMSVSTVMVWGVPSFTDASGNDKTFNVGGAYVFDNPQGQAQILERSGDGVPSLEREIENLEVRMYKLGVGMIQADKNGVESFDTQNSRTSGERAVVISVADTASKMYKKMLEMLNKWSGGSGEIEFSLNTDFTLVSLSTEEIAKVGEFNVITPIMTNEAIFNYLKNGGAISEDADYETYKEDLKNETPQLSVSPIKPVNNDNASLMDSIKNKIGL